MTAPARVSHVLRKARSEGVASVARRSLKRAACHVYASEEHVWYELDLAADRPRRELPDDVRLVRAGDDELGAAVEMGQRLEEVRRRRDQGNDLWLVLDEGGPLFRCWIYRERAPVLAARGGWLELPPATVCLEDSATTARARGRGIAPGAWTAIADSLLAEGIAAMITKVGVENEASRRAVVKSGFREIGVMRLVKAGPRKRTSFDATEPASGAALAARLAG